MATSKHKKPPRAPSPLPQRLRAIDGDRRSERIQVAITVEERRKAEQLAYDSSHTLSSWAYEIMLPFLNGDARLVDGRVVVSDPDETED